MLAQSPRCWQGPAAPDGLITLVQGHALVWKAEACSLSALSKDDRALLRVGEAPFSGSELRHGAPQGGFGIAGGDVRR